MKLFAFAFIALIVGAIANPVVPSASLDLESTRQERLVTGQIEQAIEDVAQAIKDAGLDPLEIESASVAYKLSNPELFAFSAFVDNLLFNGLSDIAINSLNYSILTNRLTFNLSLPRVQLSIDDAGFEYTFFGRTRSGSVSGSVAIVQPRIIGDIRINIGIISGITIRSLSLSFSVQNIESSLNLALFDNDLSDPVNTYLGTTIPNNLSEFESDINELLETIALRILEEVL